MYIYIATSEVLSTQLSLHPSKTFQILSFLYNVDIDIILAILSKTPGDAALMYVYYS